MKKAHTPDRHIKRMESSSEGASLSEIERVYKDRLPHFRRVATAIVGNRDAGCDAVQEGFATAVRKRESFRREGSLEAWIWRIVVNAARDQLGRRRDALEPSPDNSASTNGTQDDESARVRVALSLLPERQRLALFLRYYADLDYRTISDALEIAVGTVGVTLHSAHANLRRLLEEVPR